MKEENVRCTNPKCRGRIKDGQGNQWIDSEGELQRYCWACHVEWIEAETGDVMEAK